MVDCYNSDVIVDSQEDFHQELTVHFSDSNFGIMLSVLERLVRACEDSLYVSAPYCSRGKLLLRVG